MASRFSTPATLCASVRSVFRNFSRAGVRAEQVTHLDRRTWLPGGRGDRPLQPVLHCNRMGTFADAGHTRDDIQPGHRTDGGQGFAPKPEGRHGAEIARVELRRGVSFDGQIEIRARHALSVIRDADQAAPAVLHDDLDPAGAGVEGVLDQLLHGRRRPLDDFAGSDAIDQNIIETANRHWL